MTNLTIGKSTLTLDDIRSARRNGFSVELDSHARSLVEKGAKTITDLLGGDAPIYGVNTGFGKLASQSIADDDLEQLQVNLVRSHAAGTGRPIPAAVTRLIMLFKAQSLAAGHSGIRLETLELLIALINNDVLPVIPRQGSVGASGDLAPLAHMSLVLLGEGEAFFNGQRMTGAKALDAAGLKPVILGPKEGLALLNGTQVSTALALDALATAERNLKAATIAGAMSTDALMGSDTPFDPRIHSLRPHVGQGRLAEAYRTLMADSEIRASHVTGGRKGPGSLFIQVSAASHGRLP